MRYLVILGYTHVAKNTEDGKTHKNRQSNKDDLHLHVHHPEMCKYMTIMKSKNFSGKWVIRGNGIFGQLAFEKTTFGEPTFCENYHNRLSYK